MSNYSMTQAYADSRSQLDETDRAIIEFLSECERGFESTSKQTDKTAAEFFELNQVSSSCQRDSSSLAARTTTKILPAIGNTEKRLESPTDKAMQTVYATVPLLAPQSKPPVLNQIAKPPEKPTPSQIEKLVLEQLQISSRHNTFPYYSFAGFWVSISKQIQSRTNCFIKASDVKSCLDNFLHSFYLDPEFDIFSTKYPNLSKVELRGLIYFLRNLNYRLLESYLSISFEVQKAQKEAQKSNRWSDNSTYLLLFFLFNYSQSNNSIKDSKITFIFKKLKSCNLPYTKQQISSKLNTLKTFYKNNPSQFFKKNQNIEKGLLYCFIDVSLNIFSEEETDLFWRPSHTSSETFKKDNVGAQHKRPKTSNH